MAKCNVFLDGRINLNVVKDNSVENIIFCKPFEDSLDNVCLFETKEKEFICKYVYENGEKFIISDVVLEDGSCLKNVKFKIFIVEKGDLPFCTLNTKTSQKSSFVSNQNKTVLEEYTPNKKYLDEEYVSSNTEIFEIKENYNEIISNAKEAEKRLLKKEKLLEEERLKFLKEKEIFEKNKIIEKEIKDQKQSLIKEFLDSTEKQEKLFKDTVEKYTDEIDYKIENKSEKNLNLLKKEILLFTKDLQEARSHEIKTQLIEKLNDKEKILKENLKNIQGEVLKSLVEKYSELKDSYDDNFDKFKTKMFHELGAVNKKTLQSFFKEGKIILDKNRDSYKSELKKLAESSEAALKEKKENIDKNLKNILENVKDLLEKKTPEIDKKCSLIFEKAKQFTDTENVKLRKYVDDKVRVSSEDAKNYARRILELGSGGGSVAVQYAKGGIIDGPLNITGTILSAGIDLNSIFSSPTASGIVQTLSFDYNTNILSILPGNSVSLSSINLTFASVSANYESTYNNVFSNSATWGTGGSTDSIINANSANWNNTYSTVQTNSSNWVTLPYIENNYFNITGGSINGNVTISGNLSALGNSYFVNSYFLTTSSLSVVNTGVGPAVYIYQAAGPYPVARFIDGDGAEVLHVGNANSSYGGKVGVNTDSPSSELTVNGSISSNGNIFVSGGNSVKWNSTFTTVANNSSNWDLAYNQISTTTSQINFLSGEIQKNEYQNIYSNYETLDEFVTNPHSNLYLGYTVTLSSNNRVYILAGNNQNNTDHYIELNTNPERPIYKAQSLNNTGVIVDSFDLADFTSAKYLLQINTNFNNEVYYSEINVLGVASTGESVATEYGQLYTSPLISEYSSYISSGKLFLSATFISYTSDPTKKYIIRGLRSNFYKI